MSVKRYEFELYHCNGGEMLVSDTGDYVSYEDYAALEARCAALAGEVYDMKHPGTCLPLKRETPATDAFLAEVRAQGVEMFAAHKRERQQALRSRSMRMSEEAAGMAADAENFAAQLRKGVQS
ncbi:hypothetical protein [Enterobacter roggenkampii]|uniref:hypothetical protein n=1 Tax=Enterobacter roggenkampii TaxID=1812935 RepID=UPI0020735D01|nr:hypothetical protein [Enterobacter roggenkampii]MDN3750930.1 hypothetical protein [Enterobacter roggenkampii]MDN3760041.1 hypothetical protein [Enterobacter roggenkampii]MDN3770487.1 hypothetical protein [Enterobacter roggenkampii]HDR2502741.1 hypothetical protein [Enterobacter roggenkampii]